MDGVAEVLSPGNGAGDAATEAATETVAATEAATEAVTAAAGVETITFTAHELLALLELRPGPEAELSRRTLGLSAVGVDQLADAGTATMLARHMYRLDGDEPGPMGPASLVGYTLTAAQRWVRLVVGEDDALRTVLVVESQLSSLLVTPHTPGLFDILPLQGGTVAAQVVVPAAVNFLDQRERAAVQIVVVSNADERTVAVVAERAGELWAVEDEGERQQVERAALPALLSGIV